MKKLIALMLTLMLAAAMIPAMAEEPAAALPEEASAVLGDWYGSMFGMSIQITLAEDGTYTLVFPDMPDQVQNGTWTMKESNVIMDGDEDSPFVYNGETLVMAAMEITLTREAQQNAGSIEIAEVNAEATLEAFAGNWTAQYIGMGTAVMPASMLDEIVNISVNGAMVKLEGSLFSGLGEVEFTYSDGSLAFALDLGEVGISIVLHMLTDGMMKLDMEAAGQAVSLYLVPAEAAAENAA